MISQDRQRRFEADLIDSYDEELEMELDDRLLDGESRAPPTKRASCASSISASCSACRASS